MDQKKAGLRIESEEHNDITHGSRRMAEKIAAAHLKEDPQYYSHLEQMEEAVKKKTAIKKALHVVAKK